MSQFLRAAALAMILGAPAAGAQTAVSKATLDCRAPSTQKQMNDCAYDDFLTANAGYANSHKSISGKLSVPQRELFRRAQTSWIAYRTASCEFESSAVQGGSAHAMVKWQCTARMTRERVAELVKLGKCAEGDLACVRFKN